MEAIRSHFYLKNSKHLQFALLVNHEQASEVSPILQMTDPHEVALDLAPQDISFFGFRTDMGRQVKELLFSMPEGLKDVTVGVLWERHTWFEDV